MNPIPLHPIEKNFTSVSRYHYFLFAFLFLSKVPIFWQVIGLLFLSPPMNYECSEPNEGRNICPCTKYKWDKSVFTKTLQTKYELMCMKKYLIGVCHSMLYFGSLVGSFLFGVVSDKIGRLNTFVIGLFMMASSGCIVTLIPNVYAYLVFRVIQGLGIGGTIVSGYVLCVEHCGVRQREIVSALFHLPLTVSYMTLAGVSYYLRDCDDYQRATAIPLFFFVIMRFIFYESPKWLIDNGKIDKATKAMEGIAKFNKTSYGSVRADMEAYYQAKHSKEGEEKAQFWHIFRYRQLTINFFCMAFNYFSFGIGYYGVTQYIGQMSGHIHENVAIAGAVLVPGTLLAIVLLRFLNRRTFLMGTCLVSGILIIVVVFIPKDYAMIRVILACLCNTAFFMSLITVFLLVAELFPTTVRSSVLGILSVCARTGQMLSPFVNQLPSTVSGILLGLFAIISGLLCIPLPETKGSVLPSSINDAQTPKFPDQSTSPKVKN